MHLIFLENRNQADNALASFGTPENIRYIPLTAEALQALEEKGIGDGEDFAEDSMRDLAREEERLILEITRLSEEIETYIGSRYPEVNFTGPGILSGNAYYLQNTFFAIAKRSYLMKAMIEKYSARAVTVFHDGVHEWFAFEGYQKNPWIDFLEICSHDLGFTLDIRALDPPAKPLLSTDSTGLGTLLVRAKRQILRIRQRAGNFFPGRPSSVPQKPSFRADRDFHLLSVNAAGYDWKEVLDLLADDPKVHIHQMVPLIRKDNHWWSTTFAPSLRTQGSFMAQQLGISQIPKDSSEKERILALFDAWNQGRSQPARVDFGKVNFFPLLIPQIKTMLALSPSIIRYSDALARKILDTVSPDVACFFSITTLSDLRFSHRCRERGIPVICYQHGFGYGIRIQPGDEMCDLRWADFFLTYGTGNQPRKNPVFPAGTQYIPVGSARIEKMQECVSEPGSIQKKNWTILWIGEYSNGNTNAPFILEDTRRYRMQRSCFLKLLTNESLSLIYRPLFSQVPYDGTSAFISRVQEKSPKGKISIDSITPLENLIHKADIVILDISSPTTWGETLGQKKPAVIFCDLNQTYFSREFIQDLREVCHVCTSGQDLSMAVSRIASSPEVFVRNHAMKDFRPFQKKYLLHEGHCARHVAEFILACRKEQKQVSPG